MMYGFILLAMAAMGAAYFVASKVSNDVDAFVAPSLMFAYYLQAVPSAWFPELEFWAGFAALASAVLIYLGNDKIALALAVVSGAMREWLLSSTIAGLSRQIGRKAWRDATWWLLALALLVAAYIANAVFVFRYLRSVGVIPASGAGGRLGQGGPRFVLYTLQFCSDLYLHPRVVAYSAFFLGLTGAAYLICRRDFYLPALLLAPLAAFMFFGSGLGPGDTPGLNDYYHAGFAPFAFILVPVACHALECAIAGQGPAHSSKLRLP